MTRVTRVDLSFSGIGELLRSPFMVAEMRRRAERVKAQAEATAPRDTGRYAESFRITTTDRGGIHKDRAEATVINDDDVSVFVEYVNGDKTLRRALDAARD